MRKKNKVWIWVGVAAAVVAAAIWAIRKGKLKVPFMNAAK